VPNQPKTPIRGFRIPDDLYLAARATAEERGEDLSTVVRACLERYVKRNRKPRKDT
jgi:antitoxin component of RelBE/YafQ-DinJ toxin-antitoxin module